MKYTKTMENKKRDSSIEFLRIITMLGIVAHHYIVNSGITKEIIPSNAMTLKALFAFIFGMGGKIGINCFVLITGYFMCKSTINLKKFLKLLLEVEFYRITIYIIFLITGYTSFSIFELVKTILPIYGIGTGFTNTYLIFFLFIPYLNILIKSMNQKQHLVLLCLCLTVGTLFQTFFKADNAFNYVGWFMVLYFCAAYIRIYPCKLFDNKKIWLIITLLLIVLSWCSVIFGTWIFSKTNLNAYYYFVVDSNKLLAIAVSVSTFLVFKNLKMKYNPIINKVAASTFGVLLIHASSDVMRQWLWKDTLQNVRAFNSNYFVPHAFLSVALVYIVCTIIDMIRIYILEKPFFRFFDKRCNSFNVSINAKFNYILEKIKNI